MPASKPRPYGAIFCAVLVIWIAAWIAGFGAHDEFVKPGTHANGGGESLDAVNSGHRVEPASVRGKYGGVMTDSTISDPKTFNLWVAAETSSTGVVGNLYDTLIGQNAYTLEWEGRLANLPDISPDGKVWTFHLKPGLRWSDGVPIDADDIVFTLDMIYDPNTQGIMREGMLVDVMNPKTKQFDHVPLKYKKLDDRSVQFTFPVPYAPAYSMLSLPVAPRHKLERAWRAGKINSTWDVSTDPKELVSSGAWIMQEYVPGQRVIYGRNPNYWKHDKWGRPLPYLDQYIQVIVPDLNAETLKFKAGETDTLGVQPKDYSDLKLGENAGGYKIYDLGPGWGFSYLGFNLNPEAKVEPWKIKLFQNVKFRQAVSYAINRQLMCINLFHGFAHPLYSPLTPADSQFFDPNAPQYPYDPAKASALLDTAGITYDGEYRKFEGHEVQFNIITNVENSQRKAMCTVITKDLQAIGLNATFTPINFNKLVTNLDSTPYQWEAVVLGFTGGPEPNDGANIWYSYGNSHQWWPDQKFPHTAWEAQIDALFRQGAQTVDITKRKQIYNQWQSIAGEQLPFIYTVVNDSLVGIRNKFGNLKPSTLGAFWNQDEIYDLSATRDNP